MFNLEDFLSRPRTRQTYDTMGDALRRDAQIFMDAAKGNIDPAHGDQVSQRADEWLKTPQAKEALRAWLADIVAFLDKGMIANGPVGHDRRHLAKDLSSGLRHIANEQIKGFQTLSFIPSFLHDTGRLVEAAYLGVIPTEETSRDHALFSFAIARQFATKPYFKNISKDVSDHILYAVLAHSGKTVVTPMAHAVQSADREQLIGPEGIARLMAVQSGTFGLPLLNANKLVRAYQPRDAIDKNLDAMHAIEFYTRYLYPQAGLHGEARADTLKSVSCAFLMLATPTWVRKQIFTPEFSKDRGRSVADGDKKAIPAAAWKMARAEVTAKRAIIGSIRSVVYSEKKVLDFVFHAPGNSATPEAIKNFRENFDAMPHLAKSYLTTAVIYAAGKRTERDAADIALLKSQPVDGVSNAAAKWALNVLLPQPA